MPWGTGGGLPWGSGGDAGTPVLLRWLPRVEFMPWGTGGVLPWGSGGDAGTPEVLSRPPRTGSMPWDQMLAKGGGLAWCVASIREHVNCVSWDFQSRKGVSLDFRAREAGLGVDGLGNAS